jgi:hypothetical protein
MKNLFLLSTLLCAWTQSFSQDYPTKRELKKLFSEKQEYFGETSWETCNDDSSYFKTDTIKLYNAYGTFVKTTECCQSVNWTFHNARSFQLGELAVCQEPPLSSVPFDNPHSLKIKTDGVMLEFQVESREGQTDFFHVEALKLIESDNRAYGKLEYVLTLTRKGNEQSERKG